MEEDTGTQEFEQDLVCECGRGLKAKAENVSFTQGCRSIPEFFYVMCASCLRPTKIPADQIPEEVQEVARDAHADGIVPILVRTHDIAERI
jgi:hypothetical protein